MAYNKPLDVLLTTILIVSICTSFLCCTYLLSRPLKNLIKRGKRMVLYLCISDLIGSLFWLLNIHLKTGCPYFGFLNLFGFNASAMWTCAIGLFLYLTIKGRRPPGEEYFHIVCWTPAFAIVMAVAFTDEIGETDTVSGCWLKSARGASLYYSAVQYLFRVFLCLNINELQKLKIVSSRPSTPTLPCIIDASNNLTITTTTTTSTTITTATASHMRCSNSTTATKGQRGMILMHCCYLLYTIGPIVQAITGTNSAHLSYVAMTLGAMKGVLNVLAVNEGRLQGVISKICRKISTWWKTHSFYKTTSSSSFDSNHNIEVNMNRSIVLDDHIIAEP